MLNSALSTTSTGSTPSSKGSQRLVEVSLYSNSAEQIGGGYFMRENPFVFFDKIFNGTNPWQEQRGDTGSDTYGSMFGDSHFGLTRPARQQPQNIEVTLECTFAEFYNGCLKTARYERNIVQADGKTTKPKTEMVQLEVKPGFSEKTVLAYKGKGHQEVGHAPSDFVVKFSQAANSSYKRVENDLVLTLPITLEQVFEQRPQTFTTLDGRHITLAFDELISPQTCRRLAGEGMPVE